MKTLYGIDSKGRIRQWSINVIDNNDGTSIIRQEYGLLDGKKAIKDQLVKSGKNKGKSNATTSYTQAVSQAESKIEEKLHENYVPYIPDPETFQPPYMLPQLAQGVRKGKIIFPAAIQPKLNGICCLARKNPGGKITYHSRGGQEFEFLEHLTYGLEQLMEDNEVVHGELYNHDWSLQKIGSCVKKKQDYNEALQFWIYDVACWENGRPKVGKTFQERFLQTYGLYSRYFKLDIFPIVTFVTTEIVNNYEETKKYHDKWVAHGFEGAMLKNLHGIYQFEHRSENLEKVKEFQDAEFEIIGGKEDVDGCIVFTCVTEDEKSFDVRPKGSVEKRRQMFIELNQLIGKKLTVKFAEWSDDKIPLQPVGMVIRDYE